MAAPAGRSPRGVVLVVDDEEPVRRMTARILHDVGFHVLEAHDGEEAVTLLATLGSDVVWLVVSDVAMPRMTGDELARIMAERWPAVPVLLISGQGTPQADYQGTFLPKPFTPRELIAAVRALLPSVEVAAGGQEGAPAAVRVRTHWWEPRLPVM